jgi:hypothetical protein
VHTTLNKIIHACVSRLNEANPQAKKALANPLTITCERKVENAGRATDMCIKGKKSRRRERGGRRRDTKWSTYGRDNRIESKNDSPQNEEYKVAEKRRASVPGTRHLFAETSPVVLRGPIRSCLRAEGR